MNPSITKPYRIDACILLLSFILIYCLVPIAGSIDLSLMQRWVSPTGQFIYRNDPLLVRWNHEIFKYLILGVYACFLILYFLSFKLTRLKTWRFELGLSFLLSALSAGLIGLIKSQSRHDCPWNMLQSPGPDWLWNLSANQGHCFPAGHASTGFALLSVYFVFRKRAPAVAYAFLIASLISGSIMAWGQMMRGAHFLSHSLWTLWIIYALNSTLTFMYYKIRNRKALEFNKAISQNSPP